MTTEEELEFYRVVKDICIAAGAEGDSILHKDTINYFNVSYEKPTKWFIRFLSRSRQKCVITPVPVEDARQLAAGFRVDEAPAVFGSSRVYIESPEQMKKLKDLVTRSLELGQSGKSQ